MKAINNYNNIQEYTETKKLPVGAYKIKIIRAEEKENKNGCALCLLFDIAEGEYTNYYRMRFDTDRTSNAQNAKFKGVLQLFYPNGGQYDESNARRLKTTLENLRKSNPKLANVDFSKEWDGEVLKGCLAGMVFREKEWEFNGMTGTFAEPFQIIDLLSLMENNFTIPKPKLLNSSAKSATASSSAAEPFDDDLPF